MHWDNYKQDITKLYCVDGLSSTGVLDGLNKIHGNIFPFGFDRTIRRLVNKWGLVRGSLDLKVLPKATANILLFDTETSHLYARVFGKWGVNIHDDDIIKDWIMLCWSAKWLFSDSTYSMKLTKKEVLGWDDARITQGIWNMLNDADIIVAHNLMKFDRKVVNTRFLKHGLPLPSPYQVVDTLLHARKQFKITSNRLDYLGTFLGLGNKETTSKGLWARVEDGDEEAMVEMSKYCDQDVKLLEDVYLALRPYIQPAPNLGIIDSVGVPVCPSCGSSDLKPNGTYYTTVNAYQNYTCGDCGSHSRSRKTEIPLTHSRNILSSNPK